MRADKQGDSPSGYNREVYPLRKPATGAAFLELDSYLERVRVEAVRLLRQNPALAGEDARVLYERMVTRETAPGFESLVRRAAFGVLAARAQDRADTVDPTSGGEAA